jgi:hypothetical protein
MQTTTLIQASADVVTITSFARGDVYKRVDRDYSGTNQLQFGVVTDVMNNGEDAALSCLEFEAVYGAGVVPRIKVWKAGDDLAVFAATPEEVRSHFDELTGNLEGQIRAKRAELDKLEAAGTALAEVRSMVDSVGMNAPAVRHGVIDAVAVETPQEDA